MSPSRLRLSLLLIAALVAVLVPSVALAKSGKSKGKGRSAAADAWTWSKALNATGRYDVTVKLKKVARRKAGGGEREGSGRVHAAGLGQRPPKRAGTRIGVFPGAHQPGEGVPLGDRSAAERGGRTECRDDHPRPAGHNLPPPPSTIDWRSIRFHR